MRLSCCVVLSLAIAGCATPFETNGGGGGGAGASSGPGGGPSLPCDVDAVLDAHCRSCHGAEPRYGAPMSLVTYADTQAPSKTQPGKTVAEVMHARVHDVTAPMPPTGELDDASKKVIDDWVAAGAPAGHETCNGDGSGGGAPKVGPDALPCTPTQTLVAHASSGGAYHVPDDAGNLYECFTFKSPWNGTTQGTAWAPIIGDQRVLHHWILYRTATPQPDGGVGPCNMPADASSVAGWAPGGENFVFPKDIGLELAGPGDSLILQVHYHNIAGYKDADDASGVAFCTTDTPREHEAGVFTVGTVDVAIPPHAQSYTTSGLCPSWETSYLPEQLNIIATFPHMHGLGRSIKTDIMRGSDVGPVESLIDVKHFSFDQQSFYPTTPSVPLHPGDAVRTTCVYDNPGNDAVFFGEKTEDEMCFNFLMLYPINIFTGSRSCGLL